MFNKFIVESQRYKLRQQVFNRIKENGFADIIPKFEKYGRHYRQLIDFYEDKKLIKENNPIIINIHGGGLIMGNNNQNQWLNSWLAKKGFLVCAIEYRLVPEVLMPDQIQDICHGMSYIWNKYKDSKRPIYLMADSAGALLALYAIACNKNRFIANTFRVIGSDIQINGVMFQSGMFYTTGFNDIGLLMAHMYYGKSFKRKPFYEFIKHPEQLVRYLPRTAMSTSVGDFKRKDTMKMVSNGHWNNSDCIKCFNSGDKEFEHAYNALKPELLESIRLNNEMISYIIY